MRQDPINLHTHLEIIEPTSLLFSHDLFESDNDFSFYNHTTTNLAIYSNETSQDKLSEA